MKCISSGKKVLRYDQFFWGGYFGWLSYPICLVLLFWWAVWKWKWQAWVLISELETGYSFLLPASSKIPYWAVLVLATREEAWVSTDCFNPWKPQNSTWKRWNAQQNPKLHLPAPGMQRSEQEESFQLDPEAIIHSTWFFRTSTPEVTVIMRLLVNF